MSEIQKILEVWKKDNGYTNTVPIERQNRLIAALKYCLETLRWIDEEKTNGLNTKVVLPKLIAILKGGDE